MRLPLARCGKYDRQHFKKGLDQDGGQRRNRTADTFTIGDLRRTVETRLAGVGVPVEIRAQLQSHGLGGIQERHYDCQDHTDEKRAALEKLRDLLQGSAATVTTIRRARSKA